jgi:hypothetical protein
MYFGRTYNVHLDVHIVYFLMHFSHDNVIDAMYIPCVRDFLIKYIIKYIHMYSRMHICFIEMYVQRKIKVH